MRSRDEVLREFPNAQRVLTGERTVWRDRLAPEIKRMADRIRELEAQQAASEPVAWADHIRQLERCMAFQCGVAFALGHPLASAEEQAQAARAYSSGSHQPHPSAAGVRVTDAMVEAAARALSIEHMSGIWEFHTADARIALTAAREVQP